MADAPRFEREELDDVAHQIKEVYAQYGLTNYFAQVVEKGTVNALTLKQTATSRQPTTETWDRFFAKNARLTLGQLLRRFETTFPEEPAVTAALKVALPRRNHVAHTFFWDRAAHFDSFAGREAMLADLEADRVMFQETNALVSDLVQRTFARGGMTQERFDVLVSEEVAALRADVPKD